MFTEEYESMTPHRDSRLRSISVLGASVHPQTPPALPARPAPHPNLAVVTPFQRLRITRCSSIPLPAASVHPPAPPVPPAPLAPAPAAFVYPQASLSPAPAPPPPPAPAAIGNGGRRVIINISIPKDDLFVRVTFYLGLTVTFVGSVYSVFILSRQANMSRITAERAAYEHRQWIEPLPVLLEPVPSPFFCWASFAFPSGLHDFPSGLPNFPSGHPLPDFDVAGFDP
ncbi:OLC1v1001562C1 [Oldenlandia corymbosa var. corymbosa]|uniref:OLC1v1001562C1 n=1 Tax=Oldenlandia corymbosa var. corymbosa TaxID=529605 RepID=A0AAV1D5G3_OLDCO|nr:OLC1v1001562C1 [Oldenlandia corymbosa var. corymbosa]